MRPEKGGFDGRGKSAGGGEPATPRGRATGSVGSLITEAEKVSGDQRECRECNGCSCNECDLCCRQWAEEKKKLPFIFHKCGSLCHVMSVECEVVLHTSVTGYHLQRLYKPSLVNALSNTGTKSLCESQCEVNKAVGNMMTFADDTVVSIQKGDDLNCAQVRESQNGSSEVRVTETSWFDSD